MNICRRKSGEHTFKLLGFFTVIVIITGITGCSTAKSSNTSPLTTAVTASLTSATPSTQPTSSQTTVTTQTTVSTATATTTITGEPATVFPTVFYVPEASAYVPAGPELELFQYMLSLINQDRQADGKPPVSLAYNAAAQQHAQDMLDNFYISHWGTDGYKPYMRYTVAGGLGNEGENSAYSGWFNPAEDPTNYQTLNVHDEIATLEWTMINDDAASNWGHRDTILNRHYTKVSLGIAYDDKRLALVQQFEGDYVAFYSAPSINGETLTLLGKMKSPDIEINNISIAYEPVPQALTNPQLTGDAAYTDGYSLGERINFIVAPAPAGQTYTNLSPLAIIATKWEVNNLGQFSIQANINKALSRGKGIYTIVIVAIINGESVNITNYSIVVN